jgi:asparagine synthase (glutamine-hydrolysing)
MGAFFLFKSEQSINKDAVRDVFRKKGFDKPRRFDLAGMILWLYPKQLVGVKNYYFLDPETAVFATGTVVYKGLSYTSSLREILHDFINKTLDFDELLGNFCLLFYAKKKISVLVDRLSVYHIFFYAGGSRISNSFIALLSSFKHPLQVNRMALYEKVSKGYIVGPDTLVEGLQQLTPNLRQLPLNNCVKVLNYSSSYYHGEFCKKGFEQCVNKQISVLKGYFYAIRDLAKSFGIELGLSGGYDSRLLYALSKYLKQPISAHTHNTLGVHEKGREIAEKIARTDNSELRAIETKRMDQQSEKNLIRILYNNLYYFDGRSADNSGAFSETYTRDYRIKTLGNARLSLNGLGGEIYRNYYYTSQKRFEFKDWMFNHVYYPFFRYSIKNNKVRDDLHAYVISKMSERLGTDLRRKIDLLTMRRYYSEIRQPDCEGVIPNAHNQISFYLTPFIEYRIIQEAYKATPYIGKSFDFQASMIAMLNSQLYEIESHYGFSPNKETFSHKLYSSVKNFIPDRLWNFKKSYQIKMRNLGRRELEKYVKLYKRHKIIREIEDVLHDYASDVNWRTCMRHYAMQPNAIFLGAFLREFHNYIRK